MKNRTLIAVFFCLVSVLLLSSFTFSGALATIHNGDSGFLKYEVNETFVGNIRHIIQIDNPSYERVADGKLLVPLIRNETARCYVVIHNISSSAGQPAFTHDDSGNIYAVWNDVAIETKQRFSVQVDYYVLSFSTQYLVNSSLVADYNKSSEMYKKYTQPEELIQSNDSAIISTAQNITENAIGLHEKVSEIYDFVISHLRYAAQDEERGALWALENEVGDCSEYSYLFVALCRAIGIPARIQAGFVFHSSVETLEDGHMWAEYYLENYGWIPVDGAWQLFGKTDTKHFSSLESIPEGGSYINFLFNSTQGQEITETQAVSIGQASVNVFANSAILSGIVDVVWKINEAKFLTFLGKTFGSELIFPSDTTNEEKSILESEIDLQNVIDLLGDKPQLAQADINLVSEKVGESLGGAEILITKAFMLVISVPMVILLIIILILKLHQRKL